MSRWRKTPVRILCAVAVALVAIASQPSDSWAQSKKGAKSQRTVTFEDDVIETTLLRPDGAVVEGINKNKRASLVRIRTNFFAEIIRSAEDL